MAVMFSKLKKSVQLAAVLVFSFASTQVFASMKIGSFDPLNALNQIYFVSPSNFTKTMISENTKNRLVADFCKKVDATMKSYKWKEKPCASLPWQADLKTKDGHPLIYVVFGLGKNTTVVLGGVHPDEVTPIPIAFRVASYLSSHPEIYAGDTQIVVAPLVNPDGFLKATPSRTNSNGVDLNRNFFTMDWYSRALDLWEKRRQKIASHFPGYFPNSEVETIFQIQLVDHFKPDKILSIHAPLGFLDYDGPGDGMPTTSSQTQKKARQLVNSVSERSKNYKVVDYNFYPGSLGNFAGNERHIPTVTLELESTNPSMVETYWDQFLPGIVQSINYPFKSMPELEAKEGDNASPFSFKYYFPRKTI